MRTGVHYDAHRPANKSGSECRSIRDSAAWEPILVHVQTGGFGICAGTSCANSAAPAQTQQSLHVVLAPPWLDSVRACAL